MYFMGVLLIVLGGWLVDSGIEGRHPIVTLELLVQGGPKNVQNVLLSNKGSIAQAQSANLNPLTAVNDSLGQWAAKNLKGIGGAFN